MENLYDVIIIGSGPAGLSAAIYAKRAKLSSLTIEANFASGGQVLNTYEVIAFRPIFSLLQKLLDLLRPGKSQPVRSNQRPQALSYRTPSLHHQRRRLPM